MTEELVAKVARAIDDTYDTHRGEMTNLGQVARAVIPIVLEDVGRHLSAVQYDPAPYTALKHRLRALAGEG